MATSQINLFAREQCNGKFQNKPVCEKAMSTRETLGCDRERHNQYIHKQGGVLYDLRCVRLQQLCCDAMFVFAKKIRFAVHS